MREDTRPPRFANQGLLAGAPRSDSRDLGIAKSYSGTFLSCMVSHLRPMTSICAVARYAPFIGVVIRWTSRALFEAPAPGVNAPSSFHEAGTFMTEARIVRPQKPNWK